MANQLLDGKRSKPVSKRHGKSGFVRLGVDVSPEMKTELVSQAEQNGRSLMDDVRAALSKHLERP